MTEDDALKWEDGWWNYEIKSEGHLFRFTALNGGLPEDQRKLVDFGLITGGAAVAIRKLVEGEVRPYDDSWS